MENTPEISNAIDLLRNALIKGVEKGEREFQDAQRNLKHAEKLLRDAKEKLNDFESAFVPRPEEEEMKERVYQKGRTILVKQAIIVQQGAEFTPEKLWRTIKEVFPTNAWLTPTSHEVTRVLNKMHESGKIIRVQQGAGLKSPVYKAIPQQHSAPAPAIPAVTNP